MYYGNLFKFKSDRNFPYLKNIDLYRSLNSIVHMLITSQISHLLTTKTL